MSLGNNSVGQDIKIIINAPNGVLKITPDMIDGFTSNPDTEWKKRLPITGIQEAISIPESHSGSFMVTRKSSLLDDFWAQYEAAFYNGETIQAGTILKTIKEPDGSISQWMYLGVILRYTKSGDWKGNDFVSQELEFFASRLVKL